MLIVPLMQTVLLFLKAKTALKASTRSVLPGRWKSEATGGGGLSADPESRRELQVHVSGLFVLRAPGTSLC